MSSRRASRAQRATIAVGGGVLLAGLLPSMVGATASALTTAARVSPATEYCRSVQQAVAAEQLPGMKVSVKTVCDTPEARKVEQSLTASSTHPSSMASMAASMGSPGQTTTFQGPTNLPVTTGGSWSTYAATVPGTVSGIHSVQLHDGKVLLMAGSGNIPGNLAAGTVTTWLWNPVGNTFKSIPTPYDMFCSGHTELANGNILILGGTTAYPQYDAKGNMTSNFHGSKLAYIFNTTTETYQQTGSMANARWYPTAVTLGNGTIVAVGGLDSTGKDTNTVEQYTPATGAFTPLPSMNFGFGAGAVTHPVPAGTSTLTFPQYPSMTLLDNGNLFYSGASTGNNDVTPGIWNPLTGAYTNVTGLTSFGQRLEAASVLLPPAQAQKVMIMGGFGFGYGATANSAVTTDLTAASPHYTAAPNLSAAKAFLGAVVLPDYTVFETNGASAYKTGGVHSAEDYNPLTNKFTVWNSPTLDRMYHSEAFLLPDGRVAVLGSQPLNLQFEMHISIYSPPYLFKGQRPTLSGQNTLTRNGQEQNQYTVVTAPGSTLAHLSIVRPSATTHSTDPDQRLVDLPFTKLASGRYAVTLSANDDLTPAGWYMMFATDSVGRPSVAEWVHVS